MKIQNILLSAIVVVLCSCTDTLTENPSGSYNQYTFFDSYDHAESAIYGIYSAISDFNHYGLGQMAPSCSDDTYLTNRTNNDNNVHDIVHYTVNATNTTIATLWQYKYQALNRANTAIAGIEAMPDFHSDQNLRRLAGEARFLRAVMAYDLVVAWGDVPFSTESTASYENTFKPRVPRQTIYDTMVTDLEAAIESLPWNAPGAPERPGRGAAIAMLMRVLMQRSGYSLDMEGNLTRIDDKAREANFKRVTELWTELEGAGVHGFYEGGYDGLFHAFSESVLNNRESLWEVAMHQETGRRNGSAWGIYNGPAVAEPTGVPASQLQNYMGRANAFFIVVPEWYDFYEANDVRRDINICQYRYVWNSTTFVHTREARTYLSWYVGKWRREWMPKSRWNKNINYGDVNFCVLRYADMVLLAAEAYNELGDSPTAWSLINRVRSRAGASEINKDNYDIVMSKIFATHHIDFIDDSDEQGMVRTALYFERAFELCFEGQRKYDLLRWGILYDALKYFGERSKLNQRQAPALPLYPGYRNFQKGRNELLPIPLKELQSNYMLKGVNNPGF